jgi:malate synthase
MEDAATAEISRSQIWQWVRHGRVDEKHVRHEIELVEAGAEAKELFAAVALAEELEDFLTLPAYERLDRGGTR